MVPKLGFPHSSLPFSNIGGNGNGCAPHLVCQAKKLIRGPRSGRPVDVIDQKHAFLPSDEVTVGSLSRHPRTFPLDFSTDSAYTHHAWPGVSRMTTSLRNSTALVKPSLMLMSESSCSIEMAPLYPARRSSLIRER